MATTVTKIIDPDNGSGTDYTSLSAWEAAQQGDLTGVRDEIAVAKCRCTGGTADTTGVVIDGWTTSATQYIKIWTDPAESYRHDGSYPSGNKYRIYRDASELIRIAEQYTHLEGIAVKMSAGSAGYFTGILCGDPETAGAYSKIISCVIDGNGVGTGTGIGLANYMAIINTFVNNFTGYGIAREDSTGPFAYNCTVRNCGTGFRGHSSATFTVKNCLAVDNTTDFYSVFSASSSNNASEDSSAPGSSARTTVATNFESSGSCIFAASGNADVIGYGVNLYNDATYAFQIDILGTDRGGSGASWDIGAYEYVAAASTVPPLMYHYMHH